VLDSPLTYTGDKLDPFMVQRQVERYVTDHNAAPWRIIQHTDYPVTHHVIVLSTGLTWASKYDGMAVKQVNTLLRNCAYPPVIFVMPVSTRILLGHAINVKLRVMCESSQQRRDRTWFLDGRVDDRRAPCFEGDVAYPTQPTPTEALALLRTVQGFIRMINGR